MSGDVNQKQFDQEETPASKKEKVKDALMFGLKGSALLLAAASIAYFGFLKDSNWQSSQEQSASDLKSIAAKSEANIALATLNGFPVSAKGECTKDLLNTHLQSDKEPFTSCDIRDKTVYLGKYHISITEKDNQTPTAKNKDAITHTFTVFPLANMDSPEWQKGDFRILALDIPKIKAQFGDEKLKSLQVQQPGQCAVIKQFTQVSRPTFMNDAVSNNAVSYSLTCRYPDGIFHPINP